jgi:hypothetical protein
LQLAYDNTHEQNHIKGGEGVVTCNAKKIQTTNYKLFAQTMATHKNANIETKKPSWGA